MTPISAVRANLGRARLDRNELSGSLGDLGTFLPLLLGMSMQNGLNFASGLFFAGLFNVVTGLTFAIPMAVQPMKAIAAVALTEGLSASQIVAAGASVSVCILLLGTSGLIDLLDRVIPRPVVRGLQLGLGLSLVMKGLQMVAGTHVWWGPDSVLTGALAALVVLAFFFSRRVPAALLLFVAGIALAVVKRPEVIGQLGLGLTLPAWQPPAWSDFASSFFRAVLPQIPLTTLNSVIAVSALSADLFPDRPARPRPVAVSVGLMNLAAFGFGGMPMCHGAGGLAGQVRFGARTNGSILFLGASKVALAVLFGGSLLALCAAFPMSILGILLLFSGMELSLVSRDQTRRPDAFVMLSTAAACLAFSNIALGFCLGLVMAWGMRLARRADPNAAAPAPPDAGEAP